MLSLFKVVGNHIEAGRIVRCVVAQQLQIAKDTADAVVRIRGGRLDVIHGIMLLAVAACRIRRVPKILIRRHKVRNVIKCFIFNTKNK